jgi:hypothetical protein
MKFFLENSHLEDREEDEKINADLRQKRVVYEVEM